MELSLFSFQSTNSPLAKINPGLKLLFLFIAVISLFYIDLIPTTILFFLLILISIPLGFSLKSQFQDFKPIFVYILIYYLVNIFINFGQIKKLNQTIFIPSETITLSILRLLVSLQLARFFYKTTSTTQLKFSLEKIEVQFRRLFQKLPFCGKKIQSRPSITFTLTMIISFIPRLMELWNQLELSWKARGGTAGLKMICILFPQLLLLSFTEAENTWLAILSREEDFD